MKFGQHREIDRDVHRTAMYKPLPKHTSRVSVERADRVLMRGWNSGLRSSREAERTLIMFALRPCFTRKWRTSAETDLAGFISRHCLPSNTG